MKKTINLFGIIALVANQIACGVAVVLVMVFVACSPKPAKSVPASSGLPDIDGALGALEDTAKKAAAAKPSEEKAAQPAVKGKAAPASDFKYDLSRDGSGIVILQYIGKGGNVIVPSEIEGMPVTTLGGYMQNGFMNTKVTGVVLPDTIVIVDDDVKGFRNTPLQSITFPKGITIIPSGFFEDCKSLKSISIPDTVKEISVRAFNRSGLTSIIIPEGVEEISLSAFEYCKDLKSVTLPESIRVIGTEAFGSCSNLETVNLPSHRISYGNDAFIGCTKLSIAARKAINDSGYIGTFTN